MFKYYHLPIKSSLWLILLFAVGCAGLKSSTDDINNGEKSTSLKNAFNISQQKPPPRHIQSVQLYKKGDVNSAPFITLNSGEKLRLEFDYLNEGSKQFKIQVSHRNKNWEESPLPVDFYLTGFRETYFSGGLKSFSQRPSYFHYSYEFPNSQLSFKASGNYLLSVFDYETNELLFTLPFFISENKGSLETRIESVFVRREDLRAEDQPFSSYKYPDFIEFPRFDLSFMYVQNQFWGRSRIVENIDTSTPATVNFHLRREQSFLGNYEFNTLDLRNFSADGQKILEVQESEIPPKVILRRDVQAFEISPGFAPDLGFGLPADDRSASYADVLFRLETADNISAYEKVYLVGDFNNWTIDEDNRMRYHSQPGLWEGSAFIKEGLYAYKYVIIKNGKIDDLSLDQGFQFTKQSYLTFVYYKDPSRNFDRLLQVKQTRQQ